MLSAFRQHKLFALITICLAIVSLLGLVDIFTHISESILLPKGTTAILGLGIIWLLNHSVSKEHFSHYQGRLKIVSIVLVLLTIIGILSPTFFGLLTIGMHPGDLSVFIFGALATLLLAVEHTKDDVQPNDKHLTPYHNIRKLPF